MNENAKPDGEACRAVGVSLSNFLEYPDGSQSLTIGLDSVDEAFFGI